MWEVVVAMGALILVELAALTLVLWAELSEGVGSTQLLRATQSSCHTLGLDLAPAAAWPAWTTALGPLKLEARRLPQSLS